jgi:hypothetical protein
LLLALGGNLPGYHFAWEHLPGLHSTRVPGRLLPIACLAIAALAAVAIGRLRWRFAPLVAAIVVAADLTFNVTAVRPTAADEGNRAYAAARDEPGGRLLELAIRQPDQQEASAYLYYAMQAPRERPAGYSTVAPKGAVRVLRDLAPCPTAGQLDRLGVRLVAVFGPSGCAARGQLLARDGAVAMYRR